MGASPALVQLQMRLPERLSRWAHELVSAELIFGIDPLLIAAIMDRESLGGDALAPKGPKGKGDGGHGHGLMQIDDRSHAAFLSAKSATGAPLWQEPWANILYGAQLLKQNLNRFASEALAVAAYNCGPGNVRAALKTVPAGALESEIIAAVDRRTAGGNYSKDVLARRKKFLETK